MCVCVCVYSPIYTIFNATTHPSVQPHPYRPTIFTPAITPAGGSVMNVNSPHGECKQPRACPMLAFTRYCDYQYCMVYGIKREGSVGVVYCAIGVQ